MSKKQDVTLPNGQITDQSIRNKLNAFCPLCEKYYCDSSNKLDVVKVPFKDSRIKKPCKECRKKYKIKRKICEHKDGLVMRQRIGRGKILQ